jgi:phosphoribosylformimino-5-aminoimidazole carboxamide ribotide isomerase
MAAKFEVIPAIDIINGSCVRLSQGNFADKTVYSDSPVDMARRFEDAGLTRLHMVDLDGARAGRICNLPVLESVTSLTSLKIDFSGGIRTAEDVSMVLAAGAEMIAVGSMAVKDPDRIGEWVETFGASRVIIGADVRDGVIAVNGWETKTGLELTPFLRAMHSRRVTQVFVTDVSKDGLLAGPAMEIYREILSDFNGLEVIASGGVATLKDLEELRDIGCSGAIIGKALYEGNIDLTELVEEFGG